MPTFESHFYNPFAYKLNWNNIKYTNSTAALMPSSCSMSKGFGGGTSSNRNGLKLIGEQNRPIQTT